MAPGYRCTSFGVWCLDRPSRLVAVFRLHALVAKMRNAQARKQKPRSLWSRGQLEPI